MTLSLLICIAAFFWLLKRLRRDGISLGLPVAYLYSLLQIHVPGAYAHLVGSDLLSDSNFTEIAIRFTAIGSVCFVAGVCMAHSGVSPQPRCSPGHRQQFWVFCLFGGWIFSYGLGPLLHEIPSLGAAIDTGAGIWILGVMLGLRTALQHEDQKRTAIWLGALMVYPVLMLLFGGFLSYGSTAAIIVLSTLTISTRSLGRVLAGIVITTFLGLSVFVAYFQHRDNIREEVWGGAPLQSRIDSITDTYRDFEWFNPSNEKHLLALDARLNQNYFAGLAAQRIEDGQVDYLRGRTIWEGFISLVPRVLWPEKPVTVGSHGIVSEMTGLRLSTTTSFGIGNVMEFYVNFGYVGLAIGFSLLGWLIGTLDRKGAMAESQGALGEAILYVLPALPLIQPNGSLVDLCSGSAAALVAAFGWKLAWKHWERRVSPMVSEGMHRNFDENSPYCNESPS